MGELKAGKQLFLIEQSCRVQLNNYEYDISNVGMLLRPSNEPRVNMVLCIPSTNLTLQHFNCQHG